MALLLKLPEKNNDVSLVMSKHSQSCYDIDWMQVFELMCILHLHGLICIPSDELAIRYHAEEKHVATNPNSI